MSHCGQILVLRTHQLGDRVAAGGHNVSEVLLFPYIWPVYQKIYNYKGTYDRSYIKEKGTSVIHSFSVSFSPWPTYKIKKDWPRKEKDNREWWMSQRPLISLFSDIKSRQLSFIFISNPGLVREIEINLSLTGKRLIVRHSVEWSTGQYSFFSLFSFHLHPHITVTLEDGEKKKKRERISRLRLSCSATSALHAVHNHIVDVAGAAEVSFLLFISDGLFINSEALKAIIRWIEKNETTFTAVH